MKKFILSTLILGLSLPALSLNLYDKMQMKKEVEYIANIYRTSYAPSDWKRQHINWSLEEEETKAISAIETKAEFSVKKYQKVLKDFFRSTQDYHVGYSFHQTESAIIPLTIKYAEGKFFIAHINREKLSEVAFPYQIGDELLEFDRRPVEEVVQEIIAEHGMGVPETDHALATLLLTRRAASRAMDVPRGPIELALKKKGQDSLSHVQLIWDYTPEEINYPEVVNQRPLQLMGLNSNRASNDLNWSDKIQSTEMFAAGVPSFLLASSGVENDENEGKEKKPAPDPFQIGGRESFIPSLGTIIWQSDKKDFFNAYIYKNEKGKLIGYIRIPHYGGSAKIFDEFKGVVKKFDEITDAMVIDQINNPGGNLFYIYALQSVLTDRVLYAPKEHIRIFPMWVAESNKMLKELDEVKNDEDAQKILGKEWGGYPITHQSALFLQEFARFIIDQWNSGKTLTDPTFLWGVDKINPNQDVNYKKPLLVLTNELDFSGGDFFPAILQDNQRAKILGVRTAGAGGFVNGTSFPNAYGLASFSYTGSLAKRINDQPIENLGVTPDIDYALTAKDYQEGYKGYAKAINDALTDMIKEGKKK